ncbi:MAG: hypothetical protein E7220_07035, partial [Clostridiales bacterium]|nr:hypothetical protein [Clostridiales bacterium]
MSISVLLINITERNSIMDKKRTKMRRAGSLILTIWLCIALLPVGVYAQDLPAEEPQEDQEVVLDQSDIVESGDYYAEDSEEAAMEGEACIHEIQVVEEVPSTCQKAGVKKHSECTKCGALFDITTNEEISMQDLILPLAEHTWDGGVTVRPATKTQNGIVKYTCSVCEASYEEETYYEERPATAKSFTLDGNKLQFSSKVAKQVPSFMKDANINHIWVKAAKKKMTLNWDLAKNMKVVDGIIILRKTGKEKAYKEIKRIQFKKYQNGIAKWDPSVKYVDKTAKKKNTPYSYIVVSYLAEDSIVYISHCSDWAAGQTSASKLKTVNKASINKKSADLQVGGTVTLNLKYSKPKKTYNAKNFRWYSDNKAVAKVNKKGKVTATGVGRTTIRGRLSSGTDITCTVRVVGAFTPGTPSLRVDVANNSSISLVWTKAKYATAYDLYQSNDGLHWKNPVRVKGTSKKVTGLSHGHRYTFYVRAVNVNGKYSAQGYNSNVVNQKAVIKRRPTTLSGWPTSKTLSTGTTFSVSLKIGSPDGRKANLQMKSGSRWVTKKTVTLPKGAGTSSVRITFPSSWWGATTDWRLVIPRSSTSEAYTTKTLVIRSARRYQNPSGYVQISNSISKHGYGHYVSKVLVGNNSTKSDHIEAL